LTVVHLFTPTTESQGFSPDLLLTGQISVWRLFRFSCLSECFIHQNRRKKAPPILHLVELFEKPLCWNCETRSLLKWLRLFCEYAIPIFFVCQGKKASMG